MKLIFVIIFLFPLLAGANSSTGIVLTEKDFSSLNFNKMQSARFYYLQFLTRVEKAQIKIKYTGKEQSYLYENFIKHIQNSYTAHAAVGGTCFFGGWPSKLEDNICQAPWEYRNNKEVQAYGPTYGDSSACGSPEYFRCNPVLFGSPTANVKHKENGIDLNLNPDNGNSKGYCVDVKGTYIELTRRCEKASRKSIEDLVAGLQSKTPEGKDKRNQLVKFHESIFGKDGKSGFCGEFRTNVGEVYDACDDLRKRLTDLGLPFKKEMPPKIVKIKAPIKKKIKAPVIPKLNNYGEGLGVLSECNKFLEENSSDDIKGRRIIEGLQGGLYQCNDKQGVIVSDPLTESELEKIHDSFNQIEYLNQLNIKNFKTIVQSLMLSELAFMNQDGEFPKEKLLLNNKEAFKLQLKEKFPKIMDEDYSKVYDEVYDEVQSNKNKIPQFTYDNTIETFEALSDNNKDSVNKTCGDIHEKFSKKFKKKNWIWGAEWARSYSQEEENFIRQKRTELRSKINHVYYQSKMGFLLGTDHFREYVMNPEEDFIEKCIKEKGHMVIKPNIHKTDYQAGLLDSRNLLFASLEKLDFGNIPFTKIPRPYGVGNAINDYLKTDKKIVLETILGANSEKQKELAKFLCHRTMGIYDYDENWRYVTMVGGGVMSFAGGILCVFPTGILQAPGCLAAKTGAGMVIGGAAQEGTEAYLEGQENLRITARDLGKKATSFSDEEKRTDSQLTRSAKIGAMGLIPFVKIPTFGSGGAIVQPADETYNVLIPYAAGSGSNGFKAGKQLTVRATEQAARTGTQLTTDIVKGSTSTGTQLTTEVAKQTTNTGIQLSTEVIKQTSGTGTQLSTHVIKQVGTTTNKEASKKAIKKLKPLRKKRILDSKSNKVKNLKNQKSTPKVSASNIKEVKFLDSNGIILNSGREYLKSFRKIKTLPSKHVSDDFLQRLKWTFERPRGQGNPTMVRRVKTRGEARELLKKVLGIEGKITKESVKKALSRLKLKLSPGQSKSGTEFNIVAADELFRITELARFAVP